jgi:hypothetical protein
MKRAKLSLVFLCLAAVLALSPLLAAQTPKKNSGAAPSGGDSAASQAATPAANPLTAAAPAGRPAPVPLGAIRLENDSANLVYYAVLPFKSAELNQLLAQPRQVLERLKQSAASLAYLPPRTVAPAIPANEQEQLVLGFAVESGANAWKVWYLRVPTKGLRPTPPVFSLSQARGLSDGAGLPLDLSSIDFQLPATPVRIDGRFVDWLKFDDLMSWSERNPPFAASRQQDGTVTPIKVADGQSWAKGGTDLEHFKMIRTSSELLVMVSARSLMSKGFSCLLRCYESPAARNPAVVLEIPVESATGPVLAWEAGKAEPRVAGDFATADYYLEARFRLADLGAGLAKLSAKDWQIELSSAFSQPGMSEEFFHGRFAASQIRLVE